MLLRPTTDDVRVVVGAVGYTLLVLGLATTGLAVLALLWGDVDTATALIVGGAIGVAAGGAARAVTPPEQPLSWTRGVVAATLAWTTCSLVGAVPLYLSGHYGSFVDAQFEALSGLTTTGLTLVQDLDHAPSALLLYRHALELGGALAIVVLGLTVLTAATATASSMQPGDVRDERILPKPAAVWRRVVEVAGVVVALGFVACAMATAVAGVRGWRILEHAVSLALSASTTGGFSLQSASVGYYHSAGVELVLVPLMLAGALSFALHRTAWRGDRWRLLREIEVRGLLLSMLAVGAVVIVGLARSGALTDVAGLFRRGVFATVAAHTTTGLHNVTPRLIATDWGQLAPAALVAAMTVGGMTGSAAGGLKVLRVGVIAKGIIADVRRVLLPESAMISSSFTWGRQRRLEHGHVRAAAGMLLILLTAILAASTLILFFDEGTNLTESLFLATSAASNSGQTLGSLSPLSPTPLKLGLSALMLLGRLEWMAVFATIGFLYAGVRGRR